MRNFVKELFPIGLAGIMFWGIGKQAFNFRRDTVYQNEDLQNDTFSYVKRMAEFMGCPFSMEEETQGLVQKVVDLCSLSFLAIWRRRKVGDWKNYLTAEMAARIDQITEQKFSESGLAF
ncbi:hypothetical protein GH714_007246 [Hevea brasiliensis]|uniref:Sulfotransferase n=1 Tax=Hevea brasiliensis TaxID=3981 RepID=A0A6A6KHL2_HEVBR|nr:hypothetical protein GH714_007246 [Hevea brasiliensis]